SDPSLTLKEHIDKLWPVLTRDPEALKALAGQFARNNGAPKQYPAWKCAETVATHLQKQYQRSLTKRLRGALRMGNEDTKGSGWSPSHSWWAATPAF
ncbi:hypothetical protein QU989_25965, partial [Klebsiella pneumoniae]